MSITSARTACADFPHAPYLYDSLNCDIRAPIVDPPTMADQIARIQKLYEAQFYETVILECGKGLATEELSEETWRSLKELLALAHTAILARQYALELKIKESQEKESLLP